MSSYDLIAFDMDGTLLDDRKKIRPESFQMIREAVEAGKQVVIATGRCVDELGEYIPLLPEVRYLITVSGAVIYDLQEKTVVASSIIDPKQTGLILKMGAEFDCMSMLLNTSNYIEEDCYSRLHDFYMDQYQELYDSEASLVDDLERYYHEDPMTCNKLDFFMRSVEDRERLNEQVRSIPGNFTIAYSEITGLEITPRGVSKAEGLRRLCMHLGIDISRTIAVGDADNDLEILGAAGLGIAMGNANENVKRAADKIVSDNEHDGCAEAIRVYLMGD